MPQLDTCLSQLARLLQLTAGSRPPCSSSSHRQQLQTLVIPGATQGLEPQLKGQELAKSHTSHTSSQ